MKRCGWMVVVMILVMVGSAWADPFQVLVRETGFYTDDNRPVNSKHPLMIPANGVVTLHFRWAEKTNSFAVGDSHQIDILNETTGEVNSSTPIWWFTKDAYLAIGAGPPGTRHRGYCVLDCLGMNNLRNLVIEAR